MTERTSVLTVKARRSGAPALEARAVLRPAMRRLGAVALGFAGGWAVLYGALMPFGLGLVLGLAEDCFAPCAAGGRAGGAAAWLRGAVAAQRLFVVCAGGCGGCAVGLAGQIPARCAGGLRYVGRHGPVLCAGHRRRGGAGAVLHGGRPAGGAAGAGTAAFPARKTRLWHPAHRGRRGSGTGKPAAGTVLPRVAVCAAVELVLCSRGQPGAALACSGMLGAALCAADPALACGAAGLACGASAACILAPGRRVEAAAAYAGGCVTGVLCVQPPGQAFAVLFSAGAGILCVLALPKSWLAPVAAPADRSQPVERARYPAAATRLEAVAQSLSSLAETVNDVYNALPHRCESYRWVIDNTHDSLCFNCGRREQCWKQEYAATLEGMEALRPLLEENGRLEPAQLPGQLSRCIHPAALCAAAARSFALYRSRKESRLHAEAMRTVFTEQYSAVAEALAVLGEQLGRPGEPEPYRSDRVAAFFTSLGSPPLECAVTLDDLGRTHAAVTLPRTRFGPQELAALAREVGRICRRTLETPQVLSCKGMTTLLFSERPVLRAVFGMAGAAAQGEVSGDAVQQFCSPTAAQMILCDGMGTDRPAAVDGNLAAELTARLLKAGIPAELAARLVNVALALKSEEESGATLDLISVDLYTGTARLFKAGAAPAFWCTAAGRGPWGM